MPTRAQTRIAWPPKGANHQWDVPGGKQHPTVIAAAKQGVDLARMWYGELPTTPSRVNDHTRVVDQWKEAVPGMMALRQLFNQWQFDPKTGEYAFERSDEFVRACASRGYGQLWVLMDGPSQRSGENEPGAGTWWKSFPLTSRLHEDPTRWWGEGMDMIHASQVNGWSRLLAYLKRNPDVHASTIGWELINEPNSYKTAWQDTKGSDKQALVKTLTFYVKHCLALVAMIDKTFPGERQDVYVGGWGFSGETDLFYETHLPEFGMSCADALRHHIGNDRLVWSTHAYPQWTSGKPETLEDLNRWIRSRVGKALDAGHRVAITEINAQNDMFNNPDTKNNMTRKGFLWARNTKFFLDHNIGIFWWPFSSWANGSVIDARGNSNGFSHYHQNSLMALLTMLSAGNHPLFFTEPDEGERRAKFVKTVDVLNDPSDDDYEEDYDAGERLSMDDVGGFAHGWGGKGLAVVKPYEDGNNILMGGDGYNVLYGSKRQDDYLCLGRGGGVIRAGGGGVVSINTTGGENLIYSGSGAWNLVTVYLGRADIVVHPAAGETIIGGFDPAKGDRISFKGEFANAAALRAASKRHTTGNLSGDVDLIVTLPEGGTVRFMRGADMLDTLARSVLDFTDGWYAPGWVEPADVPGEVDTPVDTPVDPTPEPEPPVDEPPPLEPPAAPGRLFGRNANPLTLRDWKGRELAVPVITA